MKTILWSVDLRDIIAKTENRIIYEIKYMNIYDINLSTFNVLLDIQFLVASTYRKNNQQNMITKYF